MHPLVARHASTIVDLRRWLDGTHLAEVLALYEPYGEEERELILRRDLAFLPEDLAVLSRFFVLGDEVSEDDLALHVPRRFRKVLNEAGIELTRHHLVRHLDLWILCERLNPAVELYNGMDSIGLSRLMLPSRGRCLDLCAGVGTQGLLCARTAEALVAVEIQERAELFFWFNAVLNGLAHKAEFLRGDFVDAVQGERFDHVVCNPPLLPVPPDVDYALVGDGGSDGLAFVRRLLAALPALLNPGGRCHVIGTMLGGALGPDITEFEEAAAGAGLDILAILPYRSRLAPGAVFFENLVESSTLFQQRRAPDGSPGDVEATRERTARAYGRHLAALGATHLYSFFLCATRTQETAGTFRFTRHFMDTRRLWTR